MNTQFNILWFEDTEEWYTGMKSTIEDYIKDFNFTPNFTWETSIDNKKIEKYLLTTNFDLIFVDLNFSTIPNSPTGDKAIQIIREQNIFADVLFYSTSGVGSIRKIMGEESLEGVYTALRDEMFFPEKAKMLIDKIVKRSEDIINIRGLFMDAVSEFDDKLRETINKYLSSCSEKELEFINDYAYKQVFEQAKTIQKKSDEIKGSDFYILATDLRYIDSYKLSLIVNKIFKSKYPDCDKMQGFHDNYNFAILKERNKLAHAKKKPETDGVFYFDDKNNGETYIYDSTKCSEIRKNINQYSALIDKMIEYIT